MTQKTDLDRKVDVRVQMRYIKQSLDAGFNDFNDYLESLFDTLAKKEAQYRAMQQASREGSTETESEPHQAANSA